MRLETRPLWILSRWSRRLLDDLVQAGVLGLMDAVEKFDEWKNLAFQAYAKHRIKGAIRDSLRELDWAPWRSAQAAETYAVTRDLSMKLGRAPTEQELAKGMGVEQERWRRMLGEMRTVGLGSTTVATADDHDRTQEFPDAPEGQRTSLREAATAKDAGTGDRCISGAVPEGCFSGTTQTR